MAKCFVIFKKDCYRLRTWLMMWIFLNLVHVVISGFGIHPMVHTLQFQWTNIIIQMITILEILVVFIMIPLLVHEDAVTGTRAFWLTRPIAPKSMLGAKLLFIISVLIMVPLSAEFITLLINNVPLTNILMTIPEILIERSSFILCVFMLAMITNNFSRYLGILLGVVILIVGYTYLSIFIKDFDASNAGTNQTLQLSISIAQVIMLIIFGLGIIIHQYTTRKTTRSIIGMVIAVSILSAMHFLWRWDFLCPQPDAHMNADIKVVTDLNDVRIDDRFSKVKKTLNEYSKTKVLSARQSVVGLQQGQFAILKSIRKAAMAYPDKEKILSKLIKNPYQKSYDHQEFMPPLAYALKEYRLLNPFPNKFSFQDFFHLPKESFDQYKGRTGRFTADFQYEIYQYEQKAALSLQPGAKALLEAQQVILNDIKQQPFGITLLMEERRCHTYLIPSALVDYYGSYWSKDGFKSVYVLINNQRKEAFLPESLSLSSAGVEQLMPYNSMRLAHVIFQLDFVYQNDRQEGLPVIDEDWLKDAQLIRLDAKKLGVHEKKVIYPNFYLPAKSSKKNGN